MTIKLKKHCQKLVKNKNTLRLLMISLVAIFSISLYFLFNQFKADELDVQDTLRTHANISFQDESGTNHEQTSNLVEIKKVNLLYVATGLNGRSDEKIAQIKFHAEFLNPSDDSVIRQVDFVGNNPLDWTDLPGIAADKQYNLRLWADGFLPRKITNISTGQSNPIALTKLKPGDLNNDGKINISDYAIWKAGYGQKVANDPRDFNSDGKIDLYDYAMSYGSRCYNANENNQDTWCNK